MGRSSGSMKQNYLTYISMELSNRGFKMSDIPEETKKRGINKLNTAELKEYYNKMRKEGVYNEHSRKS